jgi:hypothetical protein
MDSRHYIAVLAEHGAEFCGIQEGPRESLILFADPELRTTLAVPESEFSSEEVSRTKVAVLSVCGVRGTDEHPFFFLCGKASSGYEHVGIVAF